MITKITILVILVLSLATYASGPGAKTSNHTGDAVVCCDGDPPAVLVP
jgi:hypothetical protein